MVARALIRCDDLRRLAKVAREEGVTINGRLDPDGAFTVHISPPVAATEADSGDDFDARRRKFIKRK